MRATIKYFQLLPTLTNLTLVVLFLLCCSVSSFSQEKNIPPKLQKSRISLECIQHSNDSISLKVKLRYRNGKKWVNAPGKVIEYLVISDTLQIPLGQLKTDGDGMAILDISTQTAMAIDTSGWMNFIAKFNGSETLKPTKKNVSIKPAFIELDYIEKDSVRSIKATLFQNNTANNKIPIGDMDIVVYVKRLYSNLKILELTTDESGVASDFFPDDIPGNAEGNLSIIVSLEDSDDFGTVEKRTDVKWGIPVSNELTSAERSLFSSEAPLWMVITFWILISGVWFHYYWIMYMMFRKNKDYVESEV